MCIQAGCSLGGYRKDPFDAVTIPKPKYKNGKPCERRIIDKAFQRLKEKADLPNVVFHSLRHSSTTYKLKLNHGDLKRCMHTYWTRIARLMHRSLKHPSMQIQTCGK